MDTPYDKSLKALISMTTKGYETLYLPLQERLKNWIEQTDSPVGGIEPKNTLFANAWQHGIYALKIRRAYMLPLGADAETCYREQDIWTYAIFTALIFKRLKLDLGLSSETTMETLLPLTGLQWLETYSSIFAMWQDYLSEKSVSESIFKRIEKEITAAVLMSPISEKFIVQKTEPTTSETTTPNFLFWLKQQAASNEQLSYQGQVLLFRMSEGAFVVMPALLNYFYAQQALITVPIEQKAIKKALNTISAQVSWIKTVDQKVWHTIVRGEWENRELLKGFLLPAFMVWGENEAQWPPICSNWRVEKGLEKVN